MTHPSKAKGTRWETEVARYLGVSRIGAVNGNNDQGDLDDPEWVIECKDEVKITLCEYLDQLEKELQNAPYKNYGVVVVKRRRQKTGDAYAVMPLWMLRAVRDVMRGDD